jgi:hypothetical protein
LEGAAIFAAMLGYDPISHLIPASALTALPPFIVDHVIDPHFFAGLLAQPFVTGIRVALVVCVVMTVLAGVASALRGRDQRGRFERVDSFESEVAIAGEAVQSM